MPGCLQEILEGQGRPAVIGLQALLPWLKALRNKGEAARHQAVGGRAPPEEAFSSDPRARQDYKGISFCGIWHLESGENIIPSTAIM